MPNLFTSFSIFIEGAAGTFLVWFTHSLSLWFMFDTANMEANVMALLHFTEAIVKIASTMFITYWTYKGIVKTLAKKKE